MPIEGRCSDSVTTVARSWLGSDVGLEIALASDWADLVFHVLAHVTGSRAPAALHAPAYTAWVAAQLGPIEARPLGEDVGALRALLADANMCAAVQPLAVLFSDAAQARRLATMEFGALTASHGIEPELLACLRRVIAPAELLRCSALLELEAHARLAPAVSEFAQLRAGLGEVVRCAPRLGGCPLRLSRALTHHGRVFGSRVYVGVPDARLGVDSAHVAMQAAHESTVLEVFERARSSNHAWSERRIEAVAVVVLARRAAGAGLTGQHADWARIWGVRAEHTDPASLNAEARALAQQLIREHAAGA